MMGPMKPQAIRNWLVLFTSSISIDDMVWVRGSRLCVGGV